MNINSLLKVAATLRGNRRSRDLKQRRPKETEEKITTENEQRSHVRLHFDKDGDTGRISADTLEELFREQTVGLVSREEFIKRRNKMKGVDESDDNEVSELRKKLKLRCDRLSFSMDNDEYIATNKKDQDMLEIITNKEKGISYGKDKDVEHSFLPDATRDREIIKKREGLIQEFERIQNKVKKNLISVNYSYWEINGVKHNMMIEQGCTIGEFLRRSIKTLIREVKELQYITVDNLLYVKDEYIIPHSMTFIDLSKGQKYDTDNNILGTNEEISKKSVEHDVYEENQISHHCKVVSRKWYEHNKHIFPASRWTPYIPK